MAAISELPRLLQQLTPELQRGSYVYVVLDDLRQLQSDDMVALLREPEGWSVLMAAERAMALGLPDGPRWAWILLRVHSDLEAVGLTAAFATALAAARIPCNVIAGVHHDHILVPVARAQAAMDVLQALQRSARCAAAPGSGAGSAQS